MIPKEKKIDKGYYNDAEHPLGEEEQKKVQAVAEKGQPATAGAAVGRPEQRQDSRGRRRSCWTI